MPLMEPAEFDRRPILIAIAGPNGAGKTTFYRAHLASAGLRFVNADVLADELGVAPYEAARLGDSLRRTLVGRGESFVFETASAGTHPRVASIHPSVKADWRRRATTAR
jgi:predicted ABC-type ATPase